MNGKPREPVVMPEDFPDVGSSAGLLAGAVLVGVVVGTIGAAFLKILDFGNGLRGELVERLAAWSPVAGLGVFCLLVASAALFGAWLVKRFAPTAAGSGVPYVERILRTTESPRHDFVLPVKFIGGAIALSSGLILGREGPLVQIGAVVGERVGNLFRGVKNAWKPLMAAGAGSGLATAFNAPVGGTIFIMEEVLRKVTPVGFTLTAVAVVAASFMQRGVFGMGQDFHVGPLDGGPPTALALYAGLGLLLGGVGIFYNRILLFVVDSKKSVQRIPWHARAASIGAVVGLVCWWLPTDAGGGDNVTSFVLAGGSGVGLLLAISAVRFFLGPLSYAAGTPGGLFAPIVSLGALLGAAVGILLHQAAPSLAPTPVAFAVAGMAAFFTACIRAPITGIMICLEMTGCYELFLPLLATCTGAYLVPTLFRNEPIYDSLAKPR
jgi:chloride channel protein, CIC family